MTGFEDQDVDFGEPHGDRARELFARTVAEERPRLGFTAEDLVLGGRRRVRRRRMAAVLGSTASVAAVAVWATAFAGGGGPRAAATSPAPAFVKAGPHTAPTTTTTTTTTPPTDAERTNAEKALAAAVFARMLGELDPGGKHLTHTAVPHYPSDFEPNTGVCVAKTKVQIAYGMTAYWTSDGKAPFPRAKGSTSPFIQVSIEVYAAGQDADQFSGTHDWGPIAKTQLPDGSVLQSASAGDGRRLQTVRSMPNRQQIVFSVMDDSLNDGADWGTSSLPMKPFPFTAAELNGIVGGISLPLPFSDGYQPHNQECGP